MHKQQSKTVLACCDSELLGKKILFDEIEFEVKESFYKEKKVSKKQLAELLEEADSINLVGEKVVSVALENNWIKKEDILTIGGNVPRIQIFKI